MIEYTLPVLGFCAYSGTGKTTLLARLIPLLKSEGMRIGVSSMLITALISTIRVKIAIPCVMQVRYRC